MPLIKHCLQCNKVFLYSPSASRKFCSHACYSLHKQRKTRLICRQCGKPFDTIQSEIDKAHTRNSEVKYCSRECWRKGNRGENNPAWQGGDRTLECEQCHKKFKRPRTWTIGNHVFCSVRCRTSYMRVAGINSPNWRGGVTVLNNDERKTWQMTAWRKAVYERDDYTCQDCHQRGGRLHAHHLYPFAKFPKLRFVIQNGRTLCKDCHRKIRGEELDYLKKLHLNPDRPPLSW